METRSSTLSPRVILRLVTIISFICVAGMIASAALKHLGGVLTFGCLSSVAIVILMAVIASQPQQHANLHSPSSIDPDQAVLVESLAEATISEGASEPTVRSLIGAAVALGQSFARSD
ncbi:MAG TPA: hypothetical protein VMU99_08490 [Acidimicrobiales bacterium]|nr:hypothetical protein [Acidimicrobiales bacterium]